MNFKEWGIKEWSIAGLVALMLGALSLWGSREYRHSKELTEAESKISKLKEKLEVAESGKTELEQKLKKASRTGKKKTPVQLPNGTVAYVEEEFSETLEEALSSSKAEFDRTLSLERAASEDLRRRLASKELEISKPGARGEILAEWDALSPGLSAVSVGGAMKLGAFKLGAAHPLVLDVRPRLVLGFEF